MSPRYTWPVSLRIRHAIIKPDDDEGIVPAQVHEPVLHAFWESGGSGPRAPRRDPPPLPRGRGRSRRNTASGSSRSGACGGDPRASRVAWYMMEEEPSFPLKTTRKSETFQPSFSSSFSGVTLAMRMYGCSRAMATSLFSREKPAHDGNLLAAARTASRRLDHQRRKQMRARTNQFAISITARSVPPSPPASTNSKPF